VGREGRFAHSQVFIHYASYQEGSQPVTSPRRHVYVTMVRETLPDYYSEIICTAPAEEGNGEGPWEDCTKAETEA
jgi:hypothetical protein